MHGRIYKVVDKRLIWLKPDSLRSNGRLAQSFNDSVSSIAIRKTSAGNIRAKPVTLLENG